MNSVGIVIYWDNNHYAKYVPSNGCPEYDAKPSDGEASVLELGKCEVFIHYHFSQVYSDVKWTWKPVRFPSMGQVELFYLFLQIIVSIK